MELITVEELMNEKTLLFNLVDENENIIFYAGEILTPGKLLQLRQLSKIFKDSSSSFKESFCDQTSNKTSEESEIEHSIDLSQQYKFKVEKKSFEELNLSDKDSFKSGDEKPEKLAKRNEKEFSIDSIDTSKFKGVLNSSSKIDFETQMRFKIFYQSIIDKMKKEDFATASKMYPQIRDKILVESKELLEKVNLNSQVRLLGDYDMSHPLNVATLSTILSYKMDIEASTIGEIALGALFHDVGKTYLPKRCLNSYDISDEDKKIYQSHTKIGYKIVKHQLNLSDLVAKIALQHHEFSNGSGYPYGISMQQIPIEVAIVCVCNFFDNLTSNKTKFKISNTREALKTMIKMGSQYFKADVLYAFVNMFSYNDTKNFTQMMV